MYGEARPARHVTCQYSYSSIIKFVHLLKMTEKKKLAKQIQIWKKRCMERAREIVREREKERER